MSLSGVVRRGMVAFVRVRTGRIGSAASGGWRHWDVTGSEMPDVLCADMPDVIGGEMPDVMRGDIRYVITALPPAPLQVLLSGVGG